MEAGGGAAEPEGHKPDNVQKSNQNHHHRHFFRQATRVATLMGVVLVMLCVLYRSAYPFEVFPRWSFSSFLNFSSSSMDKGERSKLNGVLKKAAMGDKTVILTTLNEAWAAPNSVFDVFLESFKIGNGTKRLLNHLVVVAMDQKAYKRCLGLHSHCYFLRTSGKNFSGVAVFMSADDDSGGGWNGGGGGGDSGGVVVMVELVVVEWRRWWWSWWWWSSSGGGGGGVVVVEVVELVELVVVMWWW
ncbi:hypothetical protein RHGRI_021139 [Rhododendron griersonianum]|uniref:Nucleotide-diphospho-sugar transferase domain-containing protein n=1 Tax=Rhododendron griersonianum TaxID=479676 RepID=A0AAV6JME1_9ERIC|nr:hypothetical protein RHGRI_021139 [Rhododendron griersonianum]